jgi:hypothetical protein
MFKNSEDDAWLHDILVRGLGCTSVFPGSSAYGAGPLGVIPVPSVVLLPTLVSERADGGGADVPVFDSAEVLTGEEDDDDVLTGT